MEVDNTAKSCYFCLNSFEEGQFIVIDNIRKDMLDIVCPGLNISLFDNLTICTSCDNLLKALFNFKSTCIENEDNLFNFVNQGDGTEKLELTRIVKHNIKLKSKGTPLLLQQGISEEKWDAIVDDYVNKQNIRVCRTCLGVLNTVEVKKYHILSENRTIRGSLGRCLPEVDIALTKDPVLCPKCVLAIEKHSYFISLCVMAQSKLSQQNSDTSTVTNSSDTPTVKNYKRKKRRNNEEDDDSDFEIDEEDIDNEDTSSDEESEGKSKHRCRHCSYSSHHMSDLRKHTLRRHYKKIRDDKLKRNSDRENHRKNNTLDVAQESQNTSEKNDSQRRNSVIQIGNLPAPSSQSSQHTHNQTPSGLGKPFLIDEGLVAKLLAGSRNTNQTKLLCNNSKTNELQGMRDKGTRVIEWSNLSLQQLLVSPIGPLLPTKNRKTNAVLARSDKTPSSHGGKRKETVVKNPVSSKASLVPNPACLSRMVKSQINKLDSQKSHSANKPTANNNTPTNKSQSSPLDVNIVHNIHFHVNNTSPMVVKTITKSDLRLKPKSTSQDISDELSLAKAAKQKLNPFSSKNKELDKDLQSYEILSSSDDNSTVNDKNKKRTKLVDKNKDKTTTRDAVEKDKVNRDSTKTPNDTLVSFTDTDDFLKKLSAYVSTKKDTRETPKDSGTTEKVTTTETDTTVTEPAPSSENFDEFISSQITEESCDSITEIDTAITEAAPSPKSFDEVIASQISEESCDTITEAAPSPEGFDEVTASQRSEKSSDTITEIDTTNIEAAPSPQVSEESSDDIMSNCDPTDNFEFCDVSRPMEPDPLCPPDPLDTSIFGPDIPEIGSKPPVITDETQCDLLLSELNSTIREIENNASKASDPLIAGDNISSETTENDRVSTENGSELPEPTANANIVEQANVNELADAEGTMESVNNVELETSEDKSQSNEESLNNCDADAEKDPLEANETLIEQNGLENDRVQTQQETEDEREQTGTEDEPQETLNNENESLTELNISESRIEEGPKVLASTDEIPTLTEINTPESKTCEVYTIPEHVIEYITQIINSNIVPGELNDTEQTASAALDDSSQNQDLTEEPEVTESQNSEILPEDVDITECKTDKSDPIDTPETTSSSLPDVKSTADNKVFEDSKVEREWSENNNHKTNIEGSTSTYATKTDRNNDTGAVFTFNSEMKIEIDEADIKVDVESLISSNRTNYCEEDVSQRSDGPGADVFNNDTTSENKEALKTKTIKRSPGTSSPSPCKKSPWNSSRAGKAKKKIFNNNNKITDHFKRVDKKFKVETQNTVNPDSSETKTAEKLSVEHQVLEHFAKSYDWYHKTSQQTDHSNNTSRSSQTSKLQELTSRQNVPSVIVIDSDSDNETKATEKRNTDNVNTPDIHLNNVMENVTKQKRKRRIKVNSKRNTVTKEKIDSNVSQFDSLFQKIIDIETSRAVAQNNINNTICQNKDTINSINIDPRNRPTTQNISFNTGIYSPVENTHIGSTEYQTDESIRRSQNNSSLKPRNRSFTRKTSSHARTQHYQATETIRGTQNPMNIEPVTQSCLGNQSYVGNIGYQTAMTIGAAPTTMNIDSRYSVVTHTGTQSPVAVQTYASNVGYPTVATIGASQVMPNINPRYTVVSQNNLSNQGVLGSQSNGVGNIGYLTAVPINTAVTQGPLRNNPNIGNIGHQTLGEPGNTTLNQNALSNTMIQRPFDNNTNLSNIHFPTPKTNIEWINGTPTQIVPDDTNIVNRASQVTVNCCSRNMAVTQNTLKSTYQNPLVANANSNRNYNQNTWPSGVPEMSGANIGFSTQNFSNNTTIANTNIVNNRVSVKMEPVNVQHSLNTANRQSPLAVNSSNYQNVELQTVDSKGSRSLLSNVQSSLPEVALDDDITSFSNNDSTLSNFLSFLGHASIGSSNPITAIEDYHPKEESGECGKDIVRKDSIVARQNMDQRSNDNNTNSTGLLVEEKKDKGTDNPVKSVEDEKEVLFIDDDPEQMVIMNDDFEEEWFDINETGESNNSVSVEPQVPVPTTTTSTASAPKRSQFQDVSTATPSTSKSVAVITKNTSGNVDFDSNNYETTTNVIVCSQNNTNNVVGESSSSCSSSDCEIVGVTYKNKPQREKFVNHPILKEQSFKCSHCGYTTPIYATYRMHLDKCRTGSFNNRTMKVTGVWQPPDPIQEMYTCKHCNFQTNYQSTYEDHIMKHKLFTCPRCLFKTLKVSDYEAHLRWHYMQSHLPV